MARFGLETELVSLAVKMDGEDLVAIHLHGRSARPPSSPVEHRVATELTDYLAGRRQTFTVRTRIEGSPFQLAVWDLLRAIPYGETRTYGDIAALLGSKDASRAVGMANHENPLPIVVPCHRVVAAGGALGGYGGGRKLKLALLAMEQRVAGWAGLPLHR